MRRRRKDSPDNPRLEGTDEALQSEGQTDEALQSEGQTDGQTDEGPIAAPGARGPWDSEERPVSEDDETRAFLGSLSVQGHPEVDVRLQVDEQSQAVTAVILVDEEGALELRAYASPRNHDMWSEVRPQILDDITKQGGEAREVHGPYGPALLTQLAGETPEGEVVAQPAVFLGVQGPRWLLRVTAFGRPALQWQEDGRLEALLREVVVFRGTEPMAPGDMLPLALPAGAQRVEDE